MEVISSRFGSDRAIERVNFETIRVIGESQFFRKTVRNGKVLMLDFEGGPTYNVGGKIFFEGMNWRIRNIKLYSIKHLDGCVLKVSPIY